MGIEGVVAKHAEHPYRPGVRGWQKLRARLTSEAVVGGVLGPRAAPTVLIQNCGQHHWHIGPPRRGALLRSARPFPAVSAVTLRLSRPTEERGRA